MGNNWTTFNQIAYAYGIEQNEAYINTGNYNVYNNPVVLGLNFRKGIRDGSFVIDEELYIYGFADAEGVGWKNIQTLN